MKKIIYFIMFLVFVSSAYSANYWVSNPTSCPTVYQSQTCTGSEEVCGANGGVTFCYDMSTLNPSGATITSNIQWTASLGGGYILDCYAYDGSSPFCDNATANWCNRDASCYDVGRLTGCIANNWLTFACDTCRSGYTYCDGSYVDGDGCEVQSGVTNCAAGANNNINSGCTCVCDSNYYDCDASGAGAGNGCEIQGGSTCTVGGVAGTYVGCTCTIPEQTYKTGVQANYSSNRPNLWAKQYGSGVLMNLTNATNTSFIINVGGCIIFPDFTTQCTASSGTGNVPNNQTIANAIINTTIARTNQIMNNLTIYSIVDSNISLVNNSIPRNIMNNQTINNIARNLTGGIGIIYNPSTGQINATAINGTGTSNAMDNQTILNNMSQWFLNISGNQNYKGNMIIGDSTDNAYTMTIHNKLIVNFTLAGGSTYYPPSIGIGQVNPTANLHIVELDGAAYYTNVIPLVNISGGNAWCDDLGSGCTANGAGIYISTGNGIASQTGAGNGGDIIFNLGKGELSGRSGLVLINTSPICTPYNGYCNVSTSAYALVNQIMNNQTIANAVINTTIARTNQIMNNQTILNNMSQFFMNISGGNFTGGINVTSLDVNQYLKVKSRLGIGEFIGVPPYSLYLNTSDFNIAVITSTYGDSGIILQSTNNIFYINGRDGKSSTSGALAFYTGSGSAALFLQNNTQNVGIKNNNPSSTLDVIGNISATQAMILNGKILHDWSEVNYTGVAAVNSVSTTDDFLTITPTAGDVIVSFNENKLNNGTFAYANRINNNQTIYSMFSGLSGIVYNPSNGQILATAVNGTPNAPNNQTIANALINTTIVRPIELVTINNTIMNNLTIYSIVDSNISLVNNSIPRNIMNNQTIQNITSSFITAGNGIIWNGSQISATAINGSSGNFATSGNVSSVIIGGGQTPNIANIPQYWSLYGNWWSASPNLYYTTTIPSKGTLTNLTVHRASAAVSHTFFLIKNNIIMALNCTIASGQTSCRNNTGILQVNAGDNISMGVVASSTTTAVVHWIIQYNTLAPIILTSGSTTDTNETTRVEAMTNVNCSSGYKSVGFWKNGTIICDIDQTLAGGELDPNLNNATTKIYMEGYFANVSNIMNNETIQNIINPYLFIVKVSSDDGIPDYLENKISAGEGISINTENEGENEVIIISNTQGSGGGNSNETLIQMFANNSYMTNGTFANWSNMERRFANATQIMNNETLNITAKTALVGGRGIVYDSSLGTITATAVNMTNSSLWSLLNNLTNVSGSGGGGNISQMYSIFMNISGGAFTGGFNATDADFSGNVGIGTTYPQSNFHIYSSISSDSFALIGLDSVNDALKIGYGGATYGRGSTFISALPDVLATAPNPSIRFLTSNVLRLMIDNVGAVTIINNLSAQNISSKEAFILNGKLIHDWSEINWSVSNSSIGAYINTTHLNNATAWSMFANLTNYNNGTFALKQYVTNGTFANWSDMERRFMNVTDRVYFTNGTFANQTNIMNNATILHLGEQQFMNISGGTFTNNVTIKGNLTISPSFNLGDISTANGIFDNGTCIIIRKGTTEIRACI